LNTAGQKVCWLTNFGDPKTAGKTGKKDPKNRGADFQLFEPPDWQGLGKA
jgi:hypothetical protein